MLAIPSRHRSLVLLGAVVLAQVLLLAVQIKRENEVRLIRVWAVGLVTPVQRAGAAVIDSLGGAWNSYVGLRHTREENQQLRAENDSLRQRVTHLEGRAAEADRLAGLLNFRETYAGAPMLPARVIGASAVGTSKTVYVDRGEADKVARDMGVITPEGVVGKVLEVYPSAAQVLLLTDKESGVGALLAGSRTQGVVRGTGEPLLTMQYVVNDQEVAVGERILTSGQDRIYPKDLPVGSVMGTQAGNPFKVIRVRPAARLDRLEEVLILLSRQELQQKKEGEAAAGVGVRKGSAAPQE